MKYTKVWFVLILLLAVTAAGDEQRSCEALISPKANCNETKLGENVSAERILSQYNVTCLNHQNISVSFRRIPELRDIFEHQFPITLYYTCYYRNGNEENASSTTVAFEWLSYRGATSLATVPVTRPDTLFSKADYCIFHGCARRVARCWRYIEKSVTITCRTDTPDDVASPSSSSMLTSTLMLSSSSYNLITATSDIEMTSTSTSTSVELMSTSSLSKENGALVSATSTMTVNSGSSPEVLLLSTVTVSLVILFAVFVLALFLSCLTYKKLKHMRRNSRSFHYMPPNFSLKELDRVLGGSMTSVVTVIQDLHFGQVDMILVEEGVAEMPPVHKQTVASSAIISEQENEIKSTLWLDIDKSRLSIPPKTANSSNTENACNKERPIQLPLSNYDTGYITESHPVSFSSSCDTGYSTEYQPNNPQSSSGYIGTQSRTLSFASGDENDYITEAKHPLSLSSSCRTCSISPLSIASGYGDVDYINKLGTKCHHPLELAASGLHNKERCTSEITSLSLSRQDYVSTGGHHYS